MGIMAVQTDIIGRVALDRHAVGYVRVSTKDQNRDTQVHQILARGAPRKLVFIDTAISGTIPASERPAAELTVLREHTGRAFSPGK
ncbi:MAG TPA: recombinase family protein [Candidatus Acidoferrum sp.]|nr:recombinase family protein [Candidatus Acidoferrum sp.]